MVRAAVHPVTDHEVPEGEYGYSSTLSLTSALDGFGWSTARPCCFTLGKDCLGGWVGTQGRSGRLWKISPPTGIRSPDRPARSESLCRLSYLGPRVEYGLHGI
jgi:hypothetical protein